MRYQNVIKAAAFCALAALLFGYTYEVLSWKDTGGGYLSSMETFYDLEKDMVDVLFLGSSHCYCSVNPGVLWEKEGMAAFSMAISGQDLASSYFCIREALKTQTPRVICVEMYCSNFHGYAVKGNLYRNLLGYGFSQNFAEAVDAISEGKETRELLLKWPIIHTRYAELTKKDFRKDPMMRTYLGYEGSFVAENVGELPVYEGEEQLAVGEQEEIWIRKMIALTREAGVQLVFFLAPFEADEETQMRYRYVENLAAEYQVPFLNMLPLYRELGIDVERDFIDNGHLNTYGALKVTDYLGEYLLERYDLPDRRGDRRYGLWEENLEVWNHQMQNRLLQQTGDLGVYLDRLKGASLGYAFVLSTKGGYLAETEDLADRMEALGIGESFFEREDVWVIEDGAVRFWAEGEDCFRHMKIGDSDLLLNKRDGILQVVIDRREYGKVSQGIDIIVYDKRLEKIVDEVGFQAEGSYRCVR